MVFNILVDGNIYPGSPFAYDASGTTSHNIFITGTGLDRTIEIVDVDSLNCMDAQIISTPQCGAICEILELSVGGSQAGKHIVEVRDFEFVPANIDIVLGDTVEFIWTGVIPHTSTSDALSGPNSWDSELLGQGATFKVVVSETGSHPYYCIPHGGPGGIGMAGTINVIDPCENGLANIGVSFETTNGSPLGYNVFLDGDYLAGPISYNDPTGFNNIIIQVPGDELPHLLTIQDLDISFCAATAQFVSPFCDVLCEIQNFTVASGEEIVYHIEVKDFEFIPTEINVTTGTPIQFLWTGQIPHTTTSDALSGTDSWDSGLLENGDAYEIIIQNSGDHPYYCIPHGGPGGIGMAGTIHAVDDCEDGLVAVMIAFDITSGNENGYNVFVDGDLISGSPFAYDNPTGTNNLIIHIPGDGLTHLITIQDTEVGFCAATLPVETDNCNAPCEINDLNIDFETTPQTHIVQVEDFEYIPNDLDINLGDTVRFVWTGVIPHTTTSDIISGVDSWDSGLLDHGAVYDLVLTTSGLHPYYCIPHGGPGGIGMAGNINVIDTDCVDGMVTASLTFTSGEGNSSLFQLFVDGNAYAGSPFEYALDGDNQINITLPGDGQIHEISIIDSEDSECSQILNIETPNCNPTCSVEMNIAGNSSCTSDGNFIYAIVIEGINTGANFELLLDGLAVPGSPFEYSATGTTVVQIEIPGDGTEHLLTLTDSDDFECTDNLTILTEVCTGDCEINATLTQDGSCDDNNMVSYAVEVAALFAGNGFNVIIDGVLYNGSPFNYGDPLSILIAGDGLAHEVQIIDMENETCMDVIILITPDCTANCVISNLYHELNPSQTHTVQVLDFEFEPKDITIDVGDVVLWDWVGVIPHTSTSDATSGPDSWESGLLGEGATYEHTFTTAGNHPYYCIPHGAPGGIGMAGNVLATEPCENDSLWVRLFYSIENAGISGYNVFVDGEVTPESPYIYNNTNSNYFDLHLFADGQTYDIVIEDVDDPSCQTNYALDMPDCDDPCFGFDAAFSIDNELGSLNVTFNCITETAVSWAWTFGDGNTGNEQTVVHTYSEAGDYEACVTITDLEGCISSICHGISVGNFACEPNFSVENEGLTISLTDLTNTTENITNWIWSFGNGISQSGIPNLVYTYEELGVYDICLTIEAGACIGDTCMTIDLTDACLIFEADFSIVHNGGMEYQFVDLTQGNPDLWLWGFGDGTSSITQNPTYTYTQNGVYNICLFVQNLADGCNEFLCEQLVVGPNAVDDLLDNQSLLIYPNPTTTVNTKWQIEGIHESDFGNQLEVMIMDVQGRIIGHQQIIGAASFEYFVDYPLNAGLYILQIKSDRRNYIGKIVVQ